MTCSACVAQGYDEDACSSHMFHEQTSACCRCELEDETFGGTILEDFILLCTKRYEQYLGHPLTEEDVPNSVVFCHRQFQELVRLGQEHF
jgi:hypothetical protein